MFAEYAFRIMIWIISWILFSIRCMYFIWLEKQQAPLLYQVNNSAEQIEKKINRISFYILFFVNSNCVKKIIDHTIFIF